MKFISATILFLCFNLFVNAQSLPLNEETGKVEFIEVVEVPGASADQLYKRAEKWFDEFYTNAGSVIKERETGKRIFGKHKINLYADDAGTEVHKGFVNYYIEIGFKDGRYRYKIDEFFKVEGVKVYINEWIESGAANQETLNSYLNQVSGFMDELTNSLKDTLNKPLEEESADDW
ncbi:MAG: DUF4468 domain-containing protein [Chitinophagales bacterium]